MKLIDLDPRWIVAPFRVGFIFRSPINRDWWQSCFINSPARREQWALIQRAINDPEDHNFQACTQGTQWQILGGIDRARFEILSVTPSIDGSAGGFWHGFITNGEIIGGI